MLISGLNHISTSTYMSIIDRNIWFKHSCRTAGTWLIVNQIRNRNMQFFPDSIRTALESVCIRPVPEPELRYASLRRYNREVLLCWYSEDCLQACPDRTASLWSWPETDPVWRGMIFLLLPLCICGRHRHEYIQNLFRCWFIQESSGTKLNIFSKSDISDIKEMKLLLMVIYYWNYLKQRFLFPVFDITYGSFCLDSWFYQQIIHADYFCDSCRRVIL